MHIVGLSIVGILGVIVFIRKKKTAKKLLNKEQKKFKKRLMTLETDSLFGSKRTMPLIVK